MNVVDAMPAAAETDAIAQTSNRKLNRKISSYCTYSPLYALLSIISKYGKCIVYIGALRVGIALVCVCVSVAAGVRVCVCA